MNKYMKYLGWIAKLRILQYFLGMIFFLLVLNKQKSVSNVNSDARVLQLTNNHIADIATKSQ